MRRAGVLALGVATLWPAVYIAGFVAFVITTIARHPSGASGLPVALVVLHLTTMVVALGLAGGYAFHIYRSPVLDQDGKVLWLLLLFFLGPISAPIYWWRYVWRAGDRRAEAAARTVAPRPPPHPAARAGP